MFQIRLEGSYYEMGYEQGRMIKDNALPQSWRRAFHETVPFDRSEFADKCEKIVRQHLPCVLEELQGVADGANADYEKVRIWPLCSYAKIQQSCSAVAISGEYTVSNSPLLIRTYDYLDVDRKDFTAYWMSPQNDYASLGFSDMTSSRYCGFNEKGLAVATSISGYAGPTQPGIVFSLAARGVIDHCSTTDEAIEFLKRIPHFHGWNFLLCDLQNNIARVETCPKRVEVIRFDEGIGVSTNHYLSEEMQMLEEESWRSEGSTERRFENIQRWFQRRVGLISTDHAVQLAKRPVSAGGICDRFTGVKGGTLWSWIYEIGKPHVLIADGPPCKNPYQKAPAF